MEKINLYIVRHGETEANVAGVLQGISQGNLTNKGKEQVKKLALYLSKEKIDLIIGSDLQRTKQTIGEITKFHEGIPVEYLPLIREWNVGVFDLRPKEEYREALKESGQTKAAFRPPQGENYYDVAERARKFLQILQKEHQNQSVLVSSHGDFIRMLIGVLLNQPVEEAIHIPQDNAGLNIFELSDEGVKAVIINSTEHLTK